MDKNGNKITILDRVRVDTGVVGIVSEFEEINGRTIVGYWVTTRSGIPQKGWATTNAVELYENRTVLN